jgi:hypothetical protein
MIYALARDNENRKIPVKYIAASLLAALEIAFVKMKIGITRE